MNVSYAHGSATRPLIGETIGDFLDHVAAGFADNEALVSTFENQRYTYAGFLAGVNGVARALGAGCRKATASASGQRTASRGCWYNSRRPRLARFS